MANSGFRARGATSVAAALALGAGGAGAVSVEPMVKAQVMGGQYFLSGDQGSLSGNLSMAVVPAVVVSDRAKLFPYWSSSYQGTKQATDPVGAGTLFQEQMQHRAGLRAVLSRPGGRWRLRPSLGYVRELYRDTKDESWGSGLFDAWRLALGAEAEYAPDGPASIRSGFEVFAGAFPNYTSLESKAGVDPFGRPLARESAGRRVLDHRGQALSAAATRAFGRYAIDATLRLQRAEFPESRLVDASGALGGGTREDYSTTLGAALRTPGELNTDRRVLASLELAWTTNASNQSSFDARRGLHQPGHYSFTDLRLGAGAHAAVGGVRRPVAWSAGVSWSRRTYPHRHPQDPVGSYLGGRLVQDTWLLSTGLKVPVDSRISLAASLQHARADSNQRYEQLYTYRYAVTNYLLGVQYEY